MVECPLLRMSSPCWLKIFLESRCSYRGWRFSSGGIFWLSWEFFQVRHISPSTFRFQKFSTLWSPAAVVKGKKALRFRSVFRARSCFQDSLQKRAEDPLCSWGLWWVPVYSWSRSRWATLGFDYSTWWSLFPRLWECIFSSKDMPKGIGVSLTISTKF